MDAAGDDNGGGGANPATTPPATDGGATPPAGGAIGGGDTPAAGGGTGDGATPPTGAIGGGAQPPAAFDFDNGTDEDYLKAVTLPDGQKWNDEAMKAYAPLLREAKIAPEVFSRFIAKDIEISKAAQEKAEKEYAESQKQAKAEFKAAGEAFRKEFNADQVKQINETFSKLSGDKTFATMVAKSPLANNITMGKMILAYRKVYGEDSVAGAGSGTPATTERGFAEVWTGKKA